MLDWMYYWCLVDKLGSHMYTKIVLKNELRMVPGFGGFGYSIDSIYEYLGLNGFCDIIYLGNKSILLLVCSYFDYNCYISLLLSRCHARLGDAAVCFYLPEAVVG